MLMYVASENMRESLSELLLKIIERNVEMNRSELENISIDSKQATRLLLDFFIKFGIVEFDPVMNTLRLGNAMGILREESEN